MLFNSSEFLLKFLPVVLVGFLLLGHFRLQRYAAGWLTAASLVFYGWWSPANLPLLIGSMIFNYAVGGSLIRRPSKPVLIFGIAVNVALLAYFKYTVFAVDVAAGLTGASWSVSAIALPLAISFFTFQQIAYLVDAKDGAVSERNFLNYCLFITFFPHLIAGPITHHREMLTQFQDPDRFRPRWDLMGVGITLFMIGLFKKVVVADPFGTYANPVFEAATSGGVQMIEAWGGALAYTLQIYFDFSGYTDMAIGLGLLFGISLPQNFNSPYKARNIIEFWSRWHMTLTRFLTAYIYNPVVVALTRRRAVKGLPPPKRSRMTFGTFVVLVALPTLLTMLISGFWHGAGFQFVIFGLLHGVFLVIAHGWRAWKVKRGIPVNSTSKVRVAGSVLLTFFCVIIALVFFRAPDVPAAVEVLKGMAGLNGVTLPTQFQSIPQFSELAAAAGIEIGELELFDGLLAAKILIFLFVVWALPNSNQWLQDFKPALGQASEASWLEKYFSIARWRPTPSFGIAVGALSTITLFYALSAAPTEFLYFNF